MEIDSSMSLQGINFGQLMIIHPFQVNPSVETFVDIILKPTEDVAPQVCA
jgi:hypothetical protein